MYSAKGNYYKATQELLDVRSDRPLTFVEWLNYETNFDRQVGFEQYTLYLNDWYKIKGVDSTILKQQYIKNIYTELLKQIALEYTTPIEKKFLSNIDYTKKEDLDVALPFFTKKLKQIAIYYSTQRDEIKLSPVKANMKGSAFGINQIVYKHIADIIQYDPGVQTQLTDLGLSQTDVLSNLKVETLELYDTEQNYYNIPNNSSAIDYTNETTDRYNYFNTSLLPDRQKTFLSETYTDSIIELIEQVPVLMQSGIVSVTENDEKELRDIENRAYAITDIITGTELDRLSEDHFSTYNNSGTLNLEYEKLAFKKYSGTDYYYLSTGDTSTLSGRLFTADSPHKDILNKFYPTVVPTPGENLYKEEYIGGFFNTTGIGLLTYTTLDFTFRFKPQNSGEIAFFPDPRSGAKGFFGASVPYESVVEYYENVNWQKKSIVNHYTFGLQKQYTNLPRFVPYQSKSDSLQTHEGISRVDDKYDFWAKSGADIWQNSDIYPINTDKSLPIDNRQLELLHGEKIIYKWKTDLYGNDYALVKTNTKPLKHLPINTNSTVYETEFQQISEEDTENKSIYKNLITESNHPEKNLLEMKQHSGTLYIRNNSYQGVQTISSELFNGLYKKYTVVGTIQYRNETIQLSAILDEIYNNIIDIDIIHDNLILETTNYIIFEKIVYDYSTTKISSGHNNYTFIKKDYHNNRYEKCSNWWYDNKSNTIVTVKTTINPELSGTTDKIIYPEIFVYSTAQGILRRTYPDPDYNDEQIFLETTQYSLSGINKFNIIDIDRVQTPVLTYNKDSERYTLMQLGFDPADNMFLLKNDFLLYDQTLDAIKTNIYKNKYVIYTLNPGNDSIQRTFMYETNPSLTYLSRSKFSYKHDPERGLLFLGCDDNTTSGNPDSLPNSSSVFIHGTEPQNMESRRDIIMCFDFMTCGFVDGDATLKPNGLSVVFFQARLDQSTDPGAAEPEYEMLDTGGLGPAFSYLSDSTTGTDTQTGTLTGLGSGYACVALDAVGNVGNTTFVPNSVTTFGPFDTVGNFSETIPVDNFNFWEDITEYDDYTELPFIRCKVTLTNLARNIKVEMKRRGSNEPYTKISDISIEPAINASKVYYDGKIYKCTDTHTSDPLTPVENDTRVSYNGGIYRCIRDHTSAAAEPPSTSKRFWRIDKKWGYTPPVWDGAGATYIKSKWEVIQDSITSAGEYDTWVGNTDYQEEYLIPQRLKVALAANTSNANAGLTVIKNITVTGAGNNT